MANTTTLADLAARALDYADMTGSSFPVTARTYNYINDGLSILHDALINSRGDYFRSTTDITLVAGTETYSLPSDFYRAIKVFYRSGGRRWKVGRFNLDETDGYKTGPIQAGTVEFWYIPQMTLLANTTDVVDSVLPNGWEDYVALHAAVRLLMREEADASQLRAERDQTLQRIIQMASPRDEGEADTISDHYGRWEGGRLVDVDTRNFRYRIMGDNVHFVELELKGV